ncbi:MAG: hypothetical protein RBT71_06160 [Flavobacteriales bacterium]|jgi:hypothetical protein|nr:hypothetical protein [Flavobacteriales bacterium]
MNAPDPHLVPLRPVVHDPRPCPVCAAPDTAVRAVHFPGIHIMAERHCAACGASFMQDLPVGFAVDHPMAFELGTGRLYQEDARLDWIYKPLVQGYRAPDHGPVRVERTVFRAHRRVVLLNTLDFLYGHVLLKLYNAAHHLRRHPDLGLVLIVPRNFRWLVPDGTAEVWTVDLGLGGMPGWHTAIDTFVQDQLPRFEEVFLGRGYAHPEFAPVRIERFTGTPAFPLAEFDSRPRHVTFVVREDRLWFAGPLHKLAYRAAGALGLKGALGRCFVAGQDRLVRRTMKAIRRTLPDVRFTVVGMGRPGGLGHLATDLRTIAIDEQVERGWVRAYANSQVVVGVHGSNMLLPTAHAAGCVEILPHDRTGNIVQDISVRWHDRMQLFLYRFVDEFAGPRAVARHVTAMFTEFTNFHRSHRLRGFAGEEAGG